MTPTSYKLKHNRPDIILCANEAHNCTILEITVPLDTNVTERTNYKKEIYMELVEAVRVLYPRYKYKIIPVVVGALGAQYHSG